MNKSMLVLNSAVAAALLTLAAAVATLLYLMFTTGDEPVTRTGLFGAVSFQTTPAEGGGLGVTMGVENAYALVAVFAVLTVVLAAVNTAYIGLRGYRNQLIARGVGRS